jgi:hypothetical protein
MRGQNKKAGVLGVRVLSEWREMKKKMKLNQSFVYREHVGSTKTHDDGKGKNDLGRGGGRGGDLAWRFGVFART